jgi:hypothetical protein
MMCDNLAESSSLCLLLAAWTRARGRLQPTFSIAAEITPFRFPVCCLFGLALRACDSVQMLLCLLNAATLNFRLTASPCSPAGASTRLQHPCPLELLGGALADNISFQCFVTKRRWLYGRTCGSEMAG